MILMRGGYPILVLMGIFTLQTILIIIFLPVIWSIARIDLLPIRIIDQALKALFIGFLSIIWLYIFRFVYYRSYSWLSVCNDKD